MKFSIIIPLYNEELNIFVLVEEILLFLKQYENQFEIILVNDGSTDKTNHILDKLKYKYFNIIKIINNNDNLGQSKSLAIGIKEASNNIIVTLDGDGQNNPKDIPMLLEKYTSNNDIFLVGGLRKNRKDSIGKKISSKIANYIRMNVLKDNCPDTGCSLKIFDKKMFLKFPFFDGIHRFLPALFKGFGAKTSYVDVDHRKRYKGNSKYGTLSRLLWGIRDIYKVLKIIKNR